MTLAPFGVNLILVLAVLSSNPCSSRKLRSVPVADNQENELLSNSVEYILSVVTVARGDTAVLHCSFDAIIQTLPNANIEWYKGQTKKPRRKARSKLVRRRKWKRHDKAPIISMNSRQRYNYIKSPLPTIKPSTDEYELTGAVAIATGKRVLINDPRYRVFRPRNSALSVMIIRKTRKKDGGVYRCNLSRSSTRHRYMVLNVTESKIEAQTSLTVMKTKVGDDVTLWCNATGYPKPVVYWMRKDRNRTLPDGNLQFWGNGLQIKSASEMDTGVYECFLDNFVQPIVNYRFTLMVEDSNPWTLEGYKMRFDSKRWYPVSSDEPSPIAHKSFLLMCDTRGAPKPLPIIRWYKSGELVRNSKHYYIIEDTPETRKTYTSSTLVIMDFRARFSGHYACVAYTNYRMKKVTFNLRRPLPMDVLNRKSHNSKAGKYNKRVSSNVENKGEKGAYDGHEDINGKEKDENHAGIIYNNGNEDLMKNGMSRDGMDVGKKSKSSFKNKAEKALVRKSFKNISKDIKTATSRRKSLKRSRTKDTLIFATFKPSTSTPSSISSSSTPHPPPSPSSSSLSSYSSSISLSNSSEYQMFDVAKRSEIESKYIYNNGVEKSGGGVLSGQSGMKNRISVFADEEEVYDEDGDDDDGEEDGDEDDSGMESD